ncbi:hypothetical protein L211DRAFT_871401 [Terfezia boudieri ATCC MYA-4762]|uniref:Uncharacterized protein n=1 Tax=Terfezia boudieri ATCC MYA-4762 TaxID=1051890 RepID=A0A3N4LMN0_9PEZI|nr:hypothetical protein L211DRAFT_871401 [Terfezia boudieri ATCC MYA-4762]
MEFYLSPAIDTDYMTSLICCTAGSSSVTHQHSTSLIPGKVQGSRICPNFTYLDKSSADPAALWLGTVDSASNELGTSTQTSAGPIESVRSSTHHFISSILKLDPMHMTALSSSYDIQFLFYLLRESFDHVPAGLRFVNVGAMIMLFICLSTALEFPPSSCIAIYLCLKMASGPDGSAANSCASTVPVIVHRRLHGFWKRANEDE